MSWGLPGVARHLRTSSFKLPQSRHVCQPHRGSAQGYKLLPEWPSAHKCMQHCLCITYILCSSSFCGIPGTLHNRSLRVQAQRIICQAVTAATLRDGCAEQTCVFTKYSTETTAALYYAIEQLGQEASSCLFADCIGGQRAAWCMPGQAGCMTAPGSTPGLHTTTSCTSWPTLAVAICLVIMRTTLPSSAWLELMTGTLFQQVGTCCMHKSMLLDCFNFKDVLPCCCCEFFQHCPLHQKLLLYTDKEITCA